MLVMYNNKDFLQIVDISHLPIYIQPANFQARRRKSTDLEVKLKGIKQWCLSQVNYITEGRTTYGEAALKI